MSDQTATTPDESPTAATAQAAGDEIAKLKAQAKATLSKEFRAISDAACRGDASDFGLRLTTHNTMTELVEAAAWLASDLADVLLKVAAGNKPHAVMRSDLARRIHEAEVRLELLREMSR